MGHPFGRHWRGRKNKEGDPIRAAMLWAGLYERGVGGVNTAKSDEG
jgi:hypothetical protein